MIDNTELKIIDEAFENLLSTLVGKLEEGDEANIRLAYEVAMEAHKDQRRKTDEPYILHPIEVARISVEEIGLGPTAVVSALLHDVVEDTDVTLQMVEDMFGPTVKKLVDGLTKLDRSYLESDLNKDSSSIQAENFKKVLTTLVMDVRVVLIKMADRLHNMRTLGAMARHKQLKIAGETSYIYAPLAHRLGLYNFKTEFQDLAMKISNPEEYYDISKQLQETKRSRESYINNFITPLTQHLDRLKIKYRIFGRPKSIFSIWNKIKTKDVVFDEIYDLFAVRIVVDVPQTMEKTACWSVYSAITDIYKPIPERLKDWITTPKANGYESLHTTVIGPQGRFVEVQIRSERMDEISEKGFAAHWKYKNVSSQPNVFDIWLDNLRDLLDFGSENATDFVNLFKTNLYSEEVFVYTPKGELKTLPKGATALDFAFSIHTDVGFHASAIKVNNKLVPMGHFLNNGDQISVTTSKKQRPKESWLKMVVTSKARSKIRWALKEERRELASLGKEKIQRKFNSSKIDFERNIDELVKFFNYDTHLDFYYAVQVDEVSLATAIKNFRVENGNLIPLVIEVEDKKVPENVKVPVKGRRVARKLTGKPKLLIGGDSAEQYAYSFANCCQPVLGDDIFAFITSNEGAKIHRASCSNAEHLLASYGYRVLSAEWVSGGNSEFVAHITIKGVDTGPGVLQKLTQQINEMDINIRSFSISGEQGYFEGKVSLLVQSTNQLSLAMKSLGQLDNVTTVVREIEEE